MSYCRLVLTGVLLLASGTTATAGGTVLPLRVLYVGNDANSPRAAQFAKCLKQHFVEVKIADRASFNVAAARDANVVLFDWLQSDSALKGTRMPFGKLDDWSTPTVLFGHAGLLAAGEWEIMGGAG